MRFFLVLTIFSLFTFLTSKGNDSIYVKDGVVYKRLILDYGPFSSVGDSNDGSPDGEWKDVSENGKLYKLYAYKNGLKHGEWVTYYTDGSIRKRILYINDKPLVWERYYDNVKRISFFDNIFGLSQQTIEGLEAFENILYQRELLQYISEKSSFLIDMPSKLLKLFTIPQKQRGFCNSRLWDQEGKTLRECRYMNGEMIDRAMYFYEDRKLDRKDEYKNEQLKKSIFYTKGGAVKKEKIY